jgi:hypothetical protein
VSELSSDVGRTAKDFTAHNEADTDSRSGTNQHKVTGGSGRAATPATLRLIDRGSRRIVLDDHGYLQAKHLRDGNVSPALVRSVKQATFVNIRRTGHTYADDNQLTIRQITLMTTNG